MFSKEFGAKAGATVRNRYQIQLKKRYLLPQKSRSRHRRCSLKEYLQGPGQVLSCCSEIFKNTNFEKHLGTAASENQHSSGKFSEGRYLSKTTLCEESHVL